MNALSTMFAGFIASKLQDTLGLSRMIGTLLNGDAPSEWMAGLKFAHQIVKNPMYRDSLTAMAKEQGIDLIEKVEKHLPIVEALLQQEDVPADLWERLDNAIGVLVDRQHLNGKSLTALVECPECGYVHGI